MDVDTDHLCDWIASQDELDWSKVLNRVIDAFDCTTGTLHFWDADKDALEIQAYRGIPEFLLPKMSTIPIGKGMAGIAAERRAPVQVCNLQTDASGVARPSARDTQMEGSLAAPLLHEGRLYGVIGVAKPISYEFTDAETDALMKVGDAICTRLRNVQPV
ncbi:MAG TPA: GAF domain-containing protein [Rhodothermales bacterium]|nr:GAF domain-containing protein [Rhodothermales bacterium]